MAMHRAACASAHMPASTPACPGPCGCWRLTVAVFLHVFTSPCSRVCYGAQNLLTVSQRLEFPASAFQSCIISSRCQPGTIGLHMEGGRDSQLANCRERAGMRARLRGISLIACAVGGLSPLWAVPSLGEWVCWVSELGEQASKRCTSTVFLQLLPSSLNDGLCLVR